MRTITEFAVITLKNAAKTKAELLASGKTAEELPAAMGEALKLEGDKLNFLMNALEVIGGKDNDLKRVIVSALAEGEKAPSGARQIGEQVYSVEHYVAMRAPKASDAPADDRGGKRGDKRGGKPGGPGGRGGERGAGGGRGPGGPGGAGGGGRGPGGPGGAGGGGRGPRPEGQGPQASSGGPKPKITIKPKDAPAT